jgi:glucose-6-phosphate 1-dehydrogenase
MSVSSLAEVTTESVGRPGDPCVMVIFGAGGDHTRRKLMPALYNLAAANLLSREFAVIGLAREAMTTDQFRDKFRQDIKEFATCALNDDVTEWFIRRLHYMAGEFTDPKAYAQLRDLLQQVNQDHGCQENYFYYMATAPTFFAPIVQQLGAASLVPNDNEQWRRIIVEKPFGRDLDSARKLNRDLLQAVHEKQIYRIDHYLGKETVQNILAFRFANGIFEPIWNRRYIDHVQITVAETVGVEQRGGYYDQSGTLRDMVPNHILQLISLTAMEPPISFQADAVRDEQSKILHAIQPLSAEDVLTHAVRGQYGDGHDPEKRMPAYRSEPSVNPESATETFVAMKLHIDNWRWAGVPFYLRTGKRLPQRHTEIAIQFRRAPFVLFRDTPVESLSPNILVLNIQPEEGISLSFGAKMPGPIMRLGNVDMSFAYSDYFGSSPSTGYERLLHDCMIGDATLFQRADMVEAGWSVVTPILDVWAALHPRSFPNYPAGTWGPKEADDLLARDGRRWRLNYNHAPKPVSSAAAKS